MQGLEAILAAGGAALLFVTFFGGFVVLMGFAIWAAKRRRDAALAGYTALAQQTGLALGGAYPMFTLHGMLDGAQVLLQHDYWIGHKGRRHYRHDLSVTLARPIGDLSLSREGFLSTIGRVFGGQDIQIGDARFDAAFVVRAANEHDARAVLDGPVREALLQAQQRLPNLYVGEGRVRLGGQGPARHEVILAQFQVLIQLARAFEGSSPAMISPYAPTP